MFRVSVGIPVLPMLGDGESNLPARRTDRMKNLSRQGKNLTARLTLDATSTSPIKGVAQPADKQQAL
jgi:hypothetical protein